MLLNIVASFFIISNPLLVLTSQVFFADHDRTANLAADGSANISVLAGENGTLPDEEQTKPQFIAAQANPDFLPIRDWSYEDPAIDAKAAIIFDTHKDKILWKYNIDEVLPIASVTKLMSAVVAVENLDLDQVVEVSLEAYQAPGFMGSLRAYENISIRTLLYAMLMESSNDAAVAISEVKGKDYFISLMNRKAQALGMTRSSFVDASGFDESNLSTVRDLTKLTEYALKFPVIWEILGTDRISLNSADNEFNHYFVNNNKLLNKLENVVGGKTGYTEQAQGCLVLVTDKPSQENLISIVLGSSDRMKATEKLLNWVKKAYLWY